jgi:hypothetical protein
MPAVMAADRAKDAAAHPAPMPSMTMASPPAAMAAHDAHQGPAQ